MLTLEEFNAIPVGKVFATGTLPNSEEGIYMTNTKYGDELRWVAKKGYAPDGDFSVYCHWSFHDTNWIAEHGDKVVGKDNIQKCVPCEPDVIRLYRK